LYLVRRIAQSKVVRLESNELVTPTVSGGKVKKPNVAWSTNTVISYRFQCRTMRYERSKGDDVLETSPVIRFAEKEQFIWIICSNYLQINCLSFNKEHGKTM
jgi:hypothetical protein